MATKNQTSEDDESGQRSFEETLFTPQQEEYIEKIVMARISTQTNSQRKTDTEQGTAFVRASVDEDAPFTAKQIQHIEKIIAHSSALAVTATYHGEKDMAKELEMSSTINPSASGRANIII